MEPTPVYLPMTDSIPVKAGSPHPIVIRSTGELEIVFDIDPDSAESKDDTFTLFSTDDESTYFQEKTPLHNISDKDGETKIRFTGLRKELNYSLGVDPGKEGDPYLVFEDQPYGSWCENPDPSMTTEFKVQFKVDPQKEENASHRFILFSTDTQKSYRQEKTIKDDLTDGDDTVEIQFEDLDHALHYSLQIDPGDGREPYFIFENRPYRELSKGSD